MKVYIAVITTEYGPNIYLGRTEKDVIEKAYDFVKLYWKDANIDEPFPKKLAEDDAIALYFDNHPTETIDYTESEI